MTDMLARLVFDDTGQDLIEYALLSGFVGVGGFLVFAQLRETMGAAYGNWVSAVSSASEPPAPSLP